MTWRLARSIQTLESELRREVPGIVLGDFANFTGHITNSDHYPWVHDSAGIGVVRACDIMHPPNADNLAANLAAKLGKHPAMKSGAYVIWNRRIISADRRSEGWRTYTGTNPHTDHVHVSVALSQAGYDSTAGWGSLTQGKGNPGGTTPAAPPTGTGTGGFGSTDAHNAGAGAGAGAQAGFHVPDSGDLNRLALYGLLLFGGVALIGVGLAKTVKPHTDKFISDGQQDALTALAPEAKAATSAAGAATKG